MNGWIGVDLDGTLAYYDGWHSATHIGRPIPAMVQRVHDWVAKYNSGMGLTRGFRADHVVSIGCEEAGTVELIVYLAAEQEDRGE